MRNLMGHGAGARNVLIAGAVMAVVAACGASAALPAASDGIGRSAPDNGQPFGGLEAVPSAAPSQAAASMAAAPAGAPASGSDGGGSGALAAIDSSLQIVYTGSLELVVADVTEALAKGKTAVAAAGGYIGASQESNSADQPTAVITYRIPATKWEDTIGALRNLATKVVSEQTQASEVGGQLVDLQARLANLRASEASLQEIARSSAKVSDLLEVQGQLTDVRGQIEQLDAQRARLADQVAYGTLVTTFGLEAQQVKVAAKGWDPAEDVDGASAALLGAGQRIVSAAIWFGIVWLPFLLVVLVLAVVAWRILRRFLPKPPVPVGPAPGWTGGSGTTPAS